MASSTKIATIAGIPLKVHFSLWFILPILALSGSAQAGFISRLIFCFGAFASVAAHEFGHCFVAQAYGIKIQEILLIPIGGMAKLDRLPKNWFEEMWISFAGPAVSLLLGLIFGAICFGITMEAQVPTQSLFYHPFYSILANLAIANFFLAFFNLLPSFPMDGGRIFRAFMTPRVGKLEATRRAAQLGKIMAIGFGILGLLLPNIMLIMIAIFIYVSAAAEYRAMQFKDGFMKNVFSFTGNAGAPPQQPFQQAQAPFIRSKPKQATRQTDTAQEVYVSSPSQARKKKTASPDDILDPYSKWH